MIVYVGPERRVLGVGDGQKVPLGRVPLIKVADEGFCEASLMQRRLQSGRLMALD